MNWIDVLLLIFMALSAMQGIMQGLLQTLLSFTGWLIANFIAVLFAHELAVVLIPYFSIPEICLLLAFIGLFSISLVLGSGLNYLLLQTLPYFPRSFADYISGGLLGLLRGILVSFTLVCIFILTPVHQTNAWQSSQFIPYVAFISQRTLGFP